eukprot:TRINITY_DN1651_c0_g1_i2.p1 TRINITY_DN1651_c0_g1~~TRINITY_DN1651_c0_g1_i2.p1  ORF type:complete len:194 (-),score=48.84 TRINITY_DN1651_c0_g1_i2:52-594(-)
MILAHKRRHSEIEPLMNDSNIYFISYNNQRNRKKKKISKHVYQDQSTQEYVDMNEDQYREDNECVLDDEFSDFGFGLFSLLIVSERKMNEMISGNSDLSSKLENVGDDDRVLSKEDLKMIVGEAIMLTKKEVSDEYENILKMRKEQQYQEFAVYLRDYLNEAPLPSYQMTANTMKTNTHI